MNQAKCKMPFTWKLLGIPMCSGDDKLHVQCAFTILMHGSNSIEIADLSLSGNVKH